MPEVNKKLQKLAEELRSKGRGGDSILAHINPREAEILKAHGGSGTINPKTGLPELLLITGDDGTQYSGVLPIPPGEQAAYDARQAQRKGGLGGVFSDLVQGTATIAPVWLAVGVPIAGAAVGQALLGGVVSTSVATAVGTGIVSGAVTAAYGGKPDDILKSAVVGGVTAGVGAQVATSVGSTIAKAAADAGYASVAQTVGGVVGGAAGSATAAGTSAAIKGKNPIDALVQAGLSGLVTGGVGATVSTYTADIPGFSNLSKDYGKTGAAVQRAVNTGLAAGVMGKDVDKSVLNSVIGSVTSTTKDFLKNGIKDSSDTLTAKYKDYTSTADAIDKNIADQDAAVNGYQKVITDTGVTTKYEAAQAALKEYETAKNAFDTGGGTQALADVANAKVAVANDLIKAYNAAYDIAAPQLKTYETTLNDLKTAQPKLETTFLAQKQTLDTSITDFITQEKANADFVSNTVNQTLAAKDVAKEALGTDLTDEQVVDFIKTGDVTTAVKDYVASNTTTRDEAATALEKAGYDATEDEITTFIGRTADDALQTKINQYVDPRQVTTDEAKTAFQDTYGYTPTDTELAQFTGQRDQASTYTNIGAYVDPRQVTTAEATTQFKDIYGYTPTDAELAQFTGQRDQASTYTDIGAYVDPRQVTADEFSSAATGENFFYDQDDQDFLGQYTGQRDETATLDAFRQYADPLATTNQEATDFYKQSYADLYGVDPESISDADVAQFMDQSGNTAESAYTSGAKDRFSQDLGFDDYTDVTEAREVLGEARPDIASWQDYGETGGVLDTGDDTSVGVKSGQPINMFDTGEDDQTTANVGLPPEDLGIPPSPPTQDYTATQPEAPPMSMEDLFANAYRGDSGVQTAGLTPPASMTDTGAPIDMGVRSLLTQQEGGTSADSAKAQGIGTLTEKYLTPTSDQQTQQKDEGTDVAESTLTSGAPAGTITSKVLGDNADQDVPVGTIAGKYFNEPKQGTEGADSAVGKSPTSDFLYSTPRTPGETTDKLGTTPIPDSYGSLLARVDPTTLTTSQDTPQTNAATGGNKMEYNPNADSDPDANGEPGVNDIGGDNFARETTLRYSPDGVERGFDPERQINDEYARYQRYLAGQGYMGGVAPQDLGISDGMLEEFNRNYNPAGGYGSQWQTVGSSRIMVNDDGTGIGVDENGETYALTPEQVQSMIRNKLLNTKGSGYVDATGGTGDIPGGSGTGKDKGKGGSFTDKLIDYATSPRGLFTLAGAALGPSMAPKGIDPRGLRSVQTGSTKQLTQTGAKGTGGRGGVRFFEKKAGGGTVGGLGYLKTAHDGMADQINATIDNKRPAKLSGGEFVIPADVVSHLGNGNSEAGAKQLYELMARIRKERTGTQKQAKQVNPKKYLPR